MNCKESPFLLPRITELLGIEHEIVSHNKYSDLVYYQLCSTKNFMQTKQLYVLTLSLQIKYYFGVLTDAIEMPERHDTSACTKTPAATTEQVSAFPSLCSCWNFGWKSCWSQKQAHLGRHSSMTLTVVQELKLIFQDPSFQTFSFPYFFHYSLKSYLPFIITFVYSFYLFPSCTLHSFSLITQILCNTDATLASPSLQVSKSHLEPWLTWSSAGDTGTSSGSLE